MNPSLLLFLTAADELQHAAHDYGLAPTPANAALLESAWAYCDQAYTILRLVRRHLT